MLDNRLTLEFREYGFVNSWCSIYFVNVVSEFVQICKLKFCKSMTLFLKRFNCSEESISDCRSSLYFRKIYHIPYSHFLIDTLFVDIVSPFSINIPVFV